MGTHFCIAAPSSSSSSRLRACSGVSPDSTFPPGNSHFSGELSFRRRCPISSRRSLRSITAATTVLMAGGALETCWLVIFQSSRQTQHRFSSSFATFLSLENLPKLLCTLHQWRPGRVQQLVADHMNAAILNRRHLLPGADFVSLLRIRAISCRRPRQHHHVRPCLGHLLLIHMLAWAAAGDRANPKKAYEVRAWQEVPAIQNRRVHVISDELLNTPGPPLMKGAKQLWKILQ